MIRVDSEIQNPLFAQIADAAFGYLHLSGEALVEADYVSEAEIRDLNRLQRGIDRVTDVLSFPSLTEIRPFTRANYPFEYDEQTGTVTIGSIVICRAQALRQAEEYGHSPERETGYLFLHGLLHVLGYDHIEDADSRRMRAAEEDILSAVGLRRDE